MDKLAIDGGTPVRTKSFPQWPVHGDLERKLLLEVLESGQWGGTGRTKLSEFEEAFAARHNAKYAVTVVNGTMAITVALKAAGVELGDEVIMPPYTFIATATSALLFGAIPVFVDVEEDTLLLDPKKVEAAITPRTKAIVAVHLAGCPASLTSLKNIAEKHGLALIEDAAQAVGAAWNGSGVGAQGDLGTFSFQSSKNLTAGEGGIILTNDEELYDKAWSIANVGRIRQGGGWYQHANIGWNLRMTELQAALLLGQLSRLEEQIERRERNGKLLSELLQDVEGLRVMRRAPQVTRHAYHLYMFKMDLDHSPSSLNKTDFLQRLHAEGIPNSAGYVSLNKNEAVITETERICGEHRLYACPVSEHSEQEVVWLPQNVLLAEEEDMHDVVKAVKKVMASFK